jgi:hypothetical protein
MRTLFRQLLKREALGAYMKQRDKCAVEQMRRQVRQLILLRETGPKSARWHAARSRLIWRLHEELRQAEQAPAPADPALADERDSTAD